MYYACLFLEHQSFLHSFSVSKSQGFKKVVTSRLHIGPYSITTLALQAISNSGHPEGKVTQSKARVTHGCTTYLCQLCTHKYGYAMHSSISSEKFEVKRSRSQDFEITHEYSGQWVYTVYFYSLLSHLFNLIFNA